MENMKKYLSYILVKPSGPDCNMACSYCFYAEKETYFGAGELHRMSEEVLEEMIQQALSKPAREFSFGWQGGEPTLMGVDFYKKALEFEKKYGKGKHIANGLQTNGLLIDDEWVKLFTEHNFLIGLSLDGPEHIHDHYRLLRGGQGTHAKVEKHAKLMLEKGVAVNALSVVSDYSVKYPEEIYTYLKDLGFEYLQFIPCVETDAQNPKQAAPFSVSAEDYGNFLCKLFDLWAADFVEGRPTTSVRLFDTFSHIYLGMTPPDCTVHKTCGEYLVVEHTGDVYSCDFFVEDTWRLGNIMEGDELHSLIDSKKQHLFGNRKAQLASKCRSCEWLAFCRGGCIKDRIRDPRDKRFNHFCESYKMFFAYAHPKFSALMREFVERERAERAAAQKTGR